MKNLLISIFVCFLGISAQALNFYPLGLGIQYREDAVCYLIIQGKDRLFLKNLLAFSQSHLAYISKVIDDAYAQHKYVEIDYDKISTISYKLPSCEIDYQIKFISNKADVKNLIYISDASYAAPSRSSRTGSHAHTR